MKNENFNYSYKSINKNLAGLELMHAFNSVGTNVFFDFGQEKIKTYKNGKNSSEWDWTIWLGNIAWRLSKNGKYIVGAEDPRDLIETQIQKIIGKGFQSFHFLSQFLDIAIKFDEGYQLTTFFNWCKKNQWIIFLPDRSCIGADCSNQEEIQKIKKISENFQITENYKKLNIPIGEVILKKIFYEEYWRVLFLFENTIWIDFGNSRWRLEKNDEYLAGWTDFYFDEEDVKENKIRNILNQLIGKKLINIETNDFMDGKLHFEDGYVLKTFICHKSEYQWDIYLKNTPIFEATIQIIDDDEKN